MTRTTGFETLEFNRVFHSETSKILRRRLIWFISLWGGLGLLGYIPLVYMSVVGGNWQALGSEDGTAGREHVLFLALTAGWFAVYAIGLGACIQGKASDRALLRWSLGLIVLDGLLAVGARAAGVPFYGLWIFWFSHSLACSIFPWNVRQSLIPIVIVTATSVLAALTIESKEILTELFWVVVLLLSLTPAVAVCWYRHSQRVQRSTLNFVRDRYGVLKQELASARKIHEAALPPEKLDGPVRLAFEYEPMRQIGGDFLHLHRSEGPDGSERLSVVIMDVTGHGIPAALSVNRLHGEIEMRFADDPDVAPGELLARLNRYVFLTMSKHSLFVTAICIQIDSGDGRVRWASGGHPPAFLRRVDGTIHELESTSFVLGACDDERFEKDELEAEFGPGDSIVAYTDGASEARNRDGKMVRISGLRDMIAGSPVPVPQGGWPATILGYVKGHRQGDPSEDDTLVVEIFRPLDQHAGANPASEPSGGQVATSFS